MINWFPGHIAKAQKTLRQQLKLIDLVLEMVDSRLPFSSHFKMTEELLGNKPTIMILNKSDLANPEQTSKWIKYWKEKDLKTTVLNLDKGKGLKDLKKYIRDEKNEVTERLKAKGRIARPIRVMVVGLPNVGKSTLINNIVQKKSVKVADRPGVTRHTQWIRIGENIELLDTPGIIPPKFENQELALKLVILGSINHKAYEPIETSNKIIALFEEKYSDYLDKGFNLENFALKRGFLKAKGEIDIDRSAVTFIRDLQKGKFGKITLDIC